MFGLGDGDPDKERFWNLMLCKIYATDKEIEEAGPFLLIALIVLIIVVLSCI